MLDFLKAVRERVTYLASLPERTIRSLASVAGGTTTLLTETLFPEVLRDTTLYRIFVGDTQKFVIEKVAQVHKEGEADQKNSSDPQYLQKKMVGGALETAGLFAMHFSPLWIFAIAGDAAGGGTVFLQRLTDQLKTNGVIDADTDVSNLTDVLEAMQESSRKSASAIDTPPLSREELSRVADEMTESYKSMFAKTTNLLPRIDEIWEQMNRLASKENVSLEHLTGILTVDVASWGKKGIGAVMAVGQTGADLFGEKILDSYAHTLKSVGDEGVTGYLNNCMQPFLQAAASHFNPSRKTWTESLLGMGDVEEKTTIETVEAETSLPGANTGGQATSATLPTSDAQRSADTEPPAPPDLKPTEPL